MKTMIIGVILLMSNLQAVDLSPSILGNDQALMAWARGVEIATIQKEQSDIKNVEKLVGEISADLENNDMNLTEVEQMFNTYDNNISVFDTKEYSKLMNVVDYVKNNLNTTKDKLYDLISEIFE